MRRLDTVALLLNWREVNWREEGQYWEYSFNKRYLIESPLKLNRVLGFISFSPFRTALQNSISFSNTEHVVNDLYSALIGVEGEENDSH